MSQYGPTTWGVSSQERGGFFSALSFSQVFGFIVFVWLLGFFVCSFLWGPQLFSGIINIYSKTESVLMMGDMYWDGLYPAHCRPLNVMLIWWEAPVVFRALKKEWARLPGKQIRAVHERNNTSLKWKAQTCFLTYLNFAVYFWCWDFILLPSINFIFCLLCSKQ